jgi:hypothetical protein
MIAPAGIIQSSIERMGYLDGRRVYRDKSDGDLAHVRRVLTSRQCYPGTGAYEHGVLRAIDDIILERSR